MSWWNIFSDINLPEILGAALSKCPSPVFVLTLSRLKLAFPWLMYAFSGYLASADLMLLWDFIIGHDSLHILPSKCIVNYKISVSSVLEWFVEDNAVWPSTFIMAILAVCKGNEWDSETFPIFWLIQNVLPPCVLRFDKVKYLRFGLEFQHAFWTFQVFFFFFVTFCFSSFLLWFVFLKQKKSKTKENRLTTSFTCMISAIKMHLVGLLFCHLSVVAYMYIVFLCFPL